MSARHGQKDEPVGSLLEVRNISKAYGSLDVLKDISFQVGEGDLCALSGVSGSGKTTLLNILGLLDRVDSGEYFLRTRAVSSLSDDTLSRLRNQAIGFVFQSFHLLPRLTALDNVGLPLLYRGVSRAVRRERAAILLKKVGLSERMTHRPEELSGGQKQRLAIARALITEPSFLLADEPTGNLDSRASTEIMDLFLSLNRDSGITVMIVTHDPGIAARCPRQIVLHDGRIVPSPPGRNEVA